MPNKDPEKQKQVWNAWYQRNKQRIAAKKDSYRKSRPEASRQSSARSRKTRRQVLNEYKMEHGCAVYGYRGHPEALDFDHLPGMDKKAHISKMFRAAWADVVKEIAKCQILCGNCHRIATAERRRVVREIKRQEKMASETQLRLHLA